MIVNELIVFLSRSGRRLISILLMASVSAGLACTVLPVQPAYAALSITVDRFDDPAVTTAGSGAAACTGAPNDCSLRGAVLVANANPGTTIDLPSGTYQLTIDGSSEAGNCTDATIGDLDIAGDGTSLIGAGAATTIIQQTTPHDRVICVDQFLAGNFTFSISGVTITGGRETFGIGGGGMISGAQGDTTNVTNVVFSNNQASGGGSPVGGGLGNGAGALNVSGSTFGGSLAPCVSQTNLNCANQSDGSGGGLYYSNNNNPDSDTLSVTNSTFINNVSTGGNGGGLLTTQASAVYSVTGSTFTGNKAQGVLAARGGGIENEDWESLILSHVNVTNNTAEFGGGIDSLGALSMTDSSISGNNATNDASGVGGGLRLAGTGVGVYLAGVTISGNTASNYSGGIHDEMSGSGNYLSLINVTISGNTAKINGAMTNTNAAVTDILNSTIASNYYSGGGANGGIASNTTISFENTIIANNQSTNCAIGGGAWSSLGNNLDSRNDCAFSATGDLHNTDPLLGGLADNGGPTQTMALGAGSPAIDAGTDTDCPPTDQRGVVRPQGLHCDIGAFEMVEYSISGNAGIGGAVLSYTDGIAKTAVADGSGNYSFTVSYDWSGTVTPSKIGYVFSPVDIPYSSVLADQSNQNYTATAVATFADVPTTYWAWNWIERLYHAGITGGCGTSPLIYCPANSVTRAQMAIFLERGINGSSYTPPPATGTVFIDVPISYWDAAWIEKLSADGITGGCGGRNYCPANPVTRAQMAIFLLRAEHGSSYTPPAATGTVFGDVPISYWDAAWIEQLYAEGITGGCGGGNYCPGNSVTRAQIAVFLVRTFGLP